MTKKSAKPEGQETQHDTDPLKQLLEKFNKNPFVKAALLESMKKGKARRRGAH